MDLATTFLSFTNRAIEADDGLGGTIAFNGYKEMVGVWNTVTEEGWKEESFGSDEATHDAFIARLQTAKETGKQVLMYIHGFANKATTCLDNSYDIWNRYDIQVIAIDWASRGHIVDYYIDEEQSEDSYDAFKTTIHKIDRWVTEWGGLGGGFTINLLIHSMGNRLFQYYEEHNHCLKDTNFFTNICLVAADISPDNLGEWCGRIEHRRGGHTIVTINPIDKALAASTVLHAERRVGDNPEDPFEGAMTDIDLGLAAGTRHRPFMSPDPRVHALFNRAFNGLDATEGLIEKHDNYYVLPGLVPQPQPNAAPWRCPIL